MGSLRACMMQGLEGNQGAAIAHGKLSQQPHIDQCSKAKADQPDQPSVWDYSKVLQTTGYEDEGFSTVGIPYM